MKAKGRSALKESLVAHGALAGRLIDMLVDAATDGHGIGGRGVLCVKCHAGGLAWTYKPGGECLDEVNEWGELKGLLSAYDPNAEVIIGLFDEGAEFFRLPLSTEGGRS